ncbi:MAG: di-trans,poly-cis-decaprenylcistransferase [Acidobacteriota bacterium]|nr:di-trans,poly-cis-decaprenylcistransferase [Acidobacteriota bacterium]
MPVVRSCSADVAGVFHVAIVMDGNGRWGAARGMGRADGHRRGADAVRRTVRAAPSLGITTLTLFAFSSDNWKRPDREVGTLLALFGEYLRSERAELKRNGVRLSVIGRRDRLPRSLVTAIEASESATGAGSRLHLRLAIDYSARGAILRAARSLPAEGEPSLDAFRKRLAFACGGDIGPDVDLLIRTGGERRLSDFLLWESAYAELCFLPRMWPDFQEADLAAAVAEFHTRQRRFGGLPAELPSRGQA